MYTVRNGSAVVAELSASDDEDACIQFARMLRANASLELWKLSERMLEAELLARISVAVGDEFEIAFDAVVETVCRHLGDAESVSRSRVWESE